MNIKLLLVFGLLSYGVLFSQTSTTVPTFVPKINNLPTSPEVALLGRFGEIPVGYYTGTAEISIPIYTIKESGIEIPIKLDYHSSGIKVADEATWVGLGWSLVPEGVIIQEVRGKKDFQESYNKLSDKLGYVDFKNRFYSLQTGNYNFRYQVGFANNNCCFAPDTGVTPADSSEIIGSLLEGYGQPDIYSYNFAGYSGKFYINSETQQIVLIDKKEDIIFERIDEFTFRAKILDGTIFNFNVTETANAGILNEYTGFTFKISNILFSNGKRIDFSYVDEKYVDIKTVESRAIMDMGAGNNQTQIYNPISYHNKKTISKITTSEEIIDFNLENREDIFSDINSTTKRLKSIDISSKVTNKKIRSFEFGYDYFPYNLNGKPANNGFTDGYYELHESTLGKRLKLNSLQEIGYDSNGLAIRTKPAHQFEYDLSNIMPQKNSNAVDFWGYYNGENNDKLLPNLDYFDYPYDVRYQNLNTLFTYGYIGANRYTNNAYAGTYMLKKIIYPTAGFTEFEYEPNSFTNQFIPDKIQQDKALKKVELLNDSKGQYAVNYHKDFKLANSATLSFTNSVFDGFTPYINPNSPVYSYDNFNGSKIVLSKIKQGVTTILKEWKVNDILRSEFESSHGKTWVEDVRIQYDSDPTVSYAVDVTNTLQYSALDTYRIASLKSVFYYYDNTNVDTSISNQCGMRIKSIKNYARTGSMTSNKIIKYYDGKLLNKFEPLTVSKTQQNKCNVTYTADHVFYDDYLTYYNRITISTDDFGVDGGTIIGYGKVEEIELDSINSDKGKNVYAYTNLPNLTKKGLPNIPYLKNGLIESQTVFDKTGVKLSETNFLYSSLSSSTIFFGIKINNQSLGGSEICNLLPNTKTEYIPFESGLEHKYSYDAYPISSEWNMISNKISKQYFGGKELSSTETYTYNSQGKMRKSTINNSNNDQLSTTYYYANDYPNSLPIETVMVNKYMTGIPLVIENSKNAELLSRQNTQYASDVSTSNLILPKYFFAGKGSMATTMSEKKVSYDMYDAIGNIMQYTLEKGTATTFLWGYGKTLPIAKIENATYAQIATALGITTAVLDTYDETYLAAINNIRSLLPQAMVTTYTYLPLIGVSTITDPKGLITYYEYDSFNRLQYIKDQYFNVLQKYCYNYLGQQTDCSIGTSTATTYKNIFRSSTFTKQFCAAGSVGSTYTYSVPAGTYLSTLSQADANTQADTEIAANGQNFVNANGICLVIPSAPAGLTFSSATVSTVSFSWSAVGGATSYKIYKNGTYVSTVTAPATTGSLSGLSASTTYNVQVLATNVSVDGALCSSVSMSTVPTVPTALTFTAATAATVNFSWSAVTGATGYKIYKNGTYVSTVAAPATTGSLSGLTASTSYSVQVLAANVSGDGVLCASVSMSTTPAIPTGLTFTSATAATVNFSWISVAGATSYKIYNNGSYVSTVASPVTTGTLSGLTSSTAYAIQILAANASGDGALCISVSMSTVPATLTGLTFTSATASTVNFSWSALAGATSYKIYKDGIYVSTIAAPATTGSLSGLAASTSYGIQVLGANASGDGVLSSSVSMSTTPAVPTGLTFTSATATLVSFSWSAVTGASSYKIYKNGTYVSTVVAPATTGSLSGLIPSTTYGVQVLAANASGDGTLCNSVSMGTVPAVPTGLTYSSATVSSLNFSWTTVAGAVGYKIYNNGVYVSSTTGLLGSLTGLTSGITYNVQILAYNAAGDGVLCSSVPMSTIVAAPTGLVYTRATDSVLMFSWNVVTGATGYKIYKDGAYISTVVDSTTGVLSGLAVATSYNVQVLAYNASGDGVLCSSVAMSTILAAPNGLTFSAANASSITFSWNAVAGATGYKIYKNGVVSGSSNTTTGSLLGLTVGTTYNVMVLAYNTWGDGMLSSSVPMSTVLVAPTGLTFTNATPASVNFSWTAVAGATGYKIYKNGVYISTVASTTGSLSGLVASTTYNVQVLAYNASGDGVLCSSVAMTTGAALLGFYKTAGTYPTIIGSTLNGSILNTLSTPIYIYLVVQSASASSGYAGGSITINGTTISASGAFTQYGQSFVSANYIYHGVIGGSLAVSGSYAGSGAAGSQMILAYSLSPGGALTYWNNSN